MTRVSEDTKSVSLLNLWWRVVILVVAASLIFFILRMMRRGGRTIMALIPRWWILKMIRHVIRARIVRVHDEMLIVDGSA